ncbi:MAG: LUD domain-containing protein, partial [Nitrospinota bacterium]|nr:LUD domain-containing protein [Nitrospinota bacterium]
RIVPHLSAASPLIRDALAGSGESPSCVSLITGPSRSADIGLTLVTGVHGPCEIHAILVPEKLNLSPGLVAEETSPFS